MSHQPLALPQAPRDSVYRAMEAIVRQNATIQRIIKPSSFRTWTGKPDDAKEFTFNIAPAMRWTPQQGPDTFATPSLMKGPLYINIEILLQGSNVSDVSNLWYALMLCFYPGSAPQSGPTTNAILQSLQAAGAHSGEVFFTQPAFDPQPDGVWLAASGQMRIDVRSDINN